MINKEFKKMLKRSKRGVSNIEYRILVDKAIEENNINLTDIQGNTLLVWNASLDTPVELVQMLLESGADVNQQCQWGITPLMECAYNNYVEKAKVLLKYGANPYLKDIFNCTALDKATKRQNDEMIELLENIIYGKQIKILEKTK